MPFFCDCVSDQFLENSQSYTVTIKHAMQHHHQVYIYIHIYEDENGNVGSNNKDVEV